MTLICEPRCATSRPYPFRIRCASNPFILCAITGIKKLVVVVVARSTSLSVLQLKVAAVTHRTDKTTRGMTMVSRLNERLTVEIIVTVSTN